MATANGTQAVDRAATLLVEVLDAEHPPTFADLQRATGLAKSTLSRLLSSLERHGLVGRGDDGSYRPGLAISRFAQSPRSGAELVALGTARLRALSEATGETINLAVLVGEQVETMAQVDSTYLLGNVNWVGMRLPLHCTALGKVFLAHGTPLPSGRLERRTPRTLSRKEIEAELATIRRRGFAITDSELEAGLVAVAAPVYGSDGDVIAGISVSGPSVRMTRARADEIGRLVAREAHVLSAQLGYQPQMKKGATVA